LKAKLEDVLKEKERELKLHERFLNLKTFCEKQIFPGTTLPVRRHVETLKEIIEKIIPDPKDRTEEMFSGEIFALLGAIYLHDAGFVKDFGLALNSEMMDVANSDGKKMLLSYEIGKMLKIPHSAIEIINYLILSNTVKKIPLEWEISENSSKAIIRNTRAFEYLFNFAHLLVDLFYSDMRYMPLKRYDRPQIVLRPDQADVDIDSREGIISIGYSARFPYELHAVEGARGYVDNMFSRFKNNVNGRLGFQYKEIRWNIVADFASGGGPIDSRLKTPASLPEVREEEKWDEAALILDRLFDHGYAMAVGDACTGKTTLLGSFVAPQLRAMSPNVYYCEMWSHPTSEIRDVMARELKLSLSSDLDIISLCHKVLEEAPCFFIIDAAERFAHLSPTEREKLERFIDFCMGELNAYVLVCGDKDVFFEWCRMFKDLSVSALYEVKPAESGLIKAEKNLERALEGLLLGLKDVYEFRLMMAFLVDKDRKMIKRRTLEEIGREASLPIETVNAYAAVLKEKGLVTETRDQGITYYSLANRFLRRPLYSVLELGVFEERRNVPDLLNGFIVEGALLDDEALMVIEAWKEHMVFTKKEMGLILASLVSRHKDCDFFLEKARRDDCETDIQPVLRLLHTDDASMRAEAVKVLAGVRSKEAINPLLLHLRNEPDQGIQDLIIKGIAATGKRRAVIAVMSVLTEMGDKALKPRAIELVCSTISGEELRQVLTDIRDIEDDPAIVKQLNQLISNPGGTG